MTDRPKSNSNFDPAGTGMCRLIEHPHKPLLEGLEFKNVLQEDVQEDVASPATCSSHRRMTTEKWGVWEGIKKTDCVHGAAVLFETSVSVH